jgi:hypothetical protein
MLSRNNVVAVRRREALELALSYRAPISEVSVWQQKRHEILCQRLTEYSTQILHIILHLSLKLPEALLKRIAQLFRFDLRH